MRIMIILALLMLIGVANAESINVSVDADNVTGWQFVVNYDKSLASLVGITGDGFVYNDGDLCYGTMLNGGVYDGELCALEFESTGKSGMLVIEINDVLLIDSELGEIDGGVAWTAVLIDTAPVIEEVPDISVVGGTDVVCSVWDADGDNVSTFWVEPCPEGVEVDAENCSFRWDAYGRYAVVVTVGDGWLLSSTEFVIENFAPWDVDFSMNVDVRDLVVVAKFENDINGDGACDIRDIVAVANHFGESYP